MDDETLLANLGITDVNTSDITSLKHVKPRSTIKLRPRRRTFVENAQRIVCPVFEMIKPLFKQIGDGLKSGTLSTCRYKGEIKQGDVFILKGQIAIVARQGEKFRNVSGCLDSRLQVVFDNGTESDLLCRSLRRMLFGDKTGRRVKTKFENVTTKDKVF